MKIDDNFSPSSDLRSQLVHRTPDAGTDQPGVQRRQGTAASDSANLSALSVELARAIDREPPELVARIQRLQEAIANGTYSVPNSAVAAKIVSASLGDH
jgi:flagellar biosynthesis anti-sigma factor FlgM